MAKKNSGGTIRDWNRNELIRKQLGHRETLIDRIRKRRLTWFWSCSRNGRLETSNKGIILPLGETRSRGSTSNTWKINVIQDLAEKEIDIKRKKKQAVMEPFL